MVVPDGGISHVGRWRPRVAPHRVRRLLELERVRTRIATDLHDDIGSSLSQIAILSEVVRQRVGGREESVREPLSQITGASSELMDTMSDIVWAIDPRKDHLSDLTQRMRRFSSDVFTARQIAFEFHAPDAARDIELGADVRRQVFLIFKESVNNIVRHSNCTRAAVDVLGQQRAHHLAHHRQRHGFRHRAAMGRPWTVEHAQADAGTWWNAAGRFEQTRRNNRDPAGGRHGATSPEQVMTSPSAALCWLADRCLIP